MSAAGTLHALVVDDAGRTWAARAVDVQRCDAEAWLSAPEPNHFSVRARGFSKSEEAAAVTLARLLAGPGGERAYWLAADRDQGKLALDSIAGFVRRTPGLSLLVEVQSSRVVLTNGSTLDVLPADEAGSWGLRPDWIVIDELCAWAPTDRSRGLLDSMLTAAVKVEHCRVLVITSAGEPVESNLGWTLREHARGSDRWRLSEVAGPAPWQSREALEDERRRMPAARFAQLFESEWCELVGDFLDVGRLDACFRGAPLLQWEPGSFVAALDIGLVHDKTVFAVLHRHPRGEDRLAAMRVWEGRKGSEVSLAEVAEHVTDACKRFRAPLLVDPWQSAQLRQAVERAGVSVKEFVFTTSSKERMASVLLDAVNGSRLVLYGEELRGELARLRMKSTGGGRYCFDHRPGEHDDRAVSLAMCLAHLAERGSPVVSTEPWMEARPSRGPMPAAAVELGLQGERYQDVTPRGEQSGPRIVDWRYRG